MELAEFFLYLFSTCGLVVFTVVMWHLMGRGAV